jgi:carbonic anhydrase/acetyltransferase-like protein (isoleucine patch superfamily)
MIYTLGDKSPIVAESAWIAPNACVIGQVELRARSSVWFGTTIRGDNDLIVVGEESNIQDNCALHTDADIQLVVGARVTVGHAVMLHGCTIGDESLIGIGSILLNHAKVGARSVLGAGSLVTEGKVIPEGVLAMGAPAKVIRDLSAKELEFLKFAATHYIERAAMFAASLRAR